MMTLKLVRANRVSFRGHEGVVEKGQTVDVEDKVGEKLLKSTVKDSANNIHHIWKLVSRTDPDSNVQIEEIDGDTYVGEDDEPEPVRAKAKARVSKAPAPKKAPVKKKAARRTRSAA
jgi:hypothetical protein